jgi:hypothetical protein
MAHYPDELPSPACGGGWPKAGRGLPTIRRAAPLDKEEEEGTERLPVPQRKKSAALRAGWNELDCHVDALLAMTRGEALAMASSPKGFLSTAWRARGCPKGGRELRSKRRAAPLIKKRGRKNETPAFSPP